MKIEVTPAAKRALARFERAVAALAFKGASGPKDHEAIEREYAQAKKRLLAQLPTRRTQ